MDLQRLHAMNYTLSSDITIALHWHFYIRNYNGNESFLQIQSQFNFQVTMRLNTINVAVSIMFNRCISANDKRVEIWE